MLAYLRADTQDHTVADLYELLLYIFYFNRFMAWILSTAKSLHKWLSKNVLYLNNILQMVSLVQRKTGKQPRIAIEICVTFYSKGPTIAHWYKFIWHRLPYSLAICTILLRFTNRILFTTPMVLPITLYLIFNMCYADKQVV